MKEANYTKNWRNAFQGEEVANTKASDSETEYFRNRNVSK